MSKFSSIQALTDTISNHKISISVIRACSFSTDWFEVELKINDRPFIVQVDDEYSDFRYKIPELNLCIVLKSLEELREYADYSTWCAATSVDSNNLQAKKYYQSSSSMIEKIEQLIGEINSQISDLEFSLNSGAAQYLRSIQ